MGENSSIKPVILFDGVCNLCNTSVDFVIRRDKKKKFLFASLQSVAAQQLVQQTEGHQVSLDSVVLVSEGQVYDRSTAALKIAKGLSGLWPILYWLIILPKGIRDRVYDWIASNRYRWFGKRDTCRLPSADEKERFLDSY